MGGVYWAEFDLILEGCDEEISKVRHTNNLILAYQIGARCE